MVSWLSFQIGLFMRVSYRKGNGLPLAKVDVVWQCFDALRKGKKKIVLIQQKRKETHARTHTNTHTHTHTHIHTHTHTHTHTYTYTHKQTNKQTHKHTNKNKNKNKKKKQKKNKKKKQKNNKQTKQIKTLKLKPHTHTHTQFLFDWSPDRLLIILVWSIHIILLFSSPSISLRFVSSISPVYLHHFRLSRIIRNIHSPAKLNY